MRNLLNSICLIALLLFAGGCGAGTKEIGPAEDTPEMTDEQNEAMKQGMEESLKHMPPEQQKQLREQMKKQAN